MEFGNQSLYIPSIHPEGLEFLIILPNLKFEDGFTGYVIGLNGPDILFDFHLVSFCN